MANPRIEDIDGVRWIYLSRPEELNALRKEDFDEVAAAVEEATRHMDAVVFSGEGERAFSAGLHTASFLDLTPHQARLLIVKLKSFLDQVRTAPIPTLCAINGYCLGGAMELALACDIRICTQESAFGMPEIKLGVPSVLDAALLKEHIGLAKAKEMLLTGDLFYAEEMETCGLINKVVDSDVLESAVQDMLGRVTAHSKIALASQKRLFETWENSSLEEANKASVNEFALAFGAEQTRENIEVYARRFRKEGS